MSQDRGCLGLWTPVASNRAYAICPYTSRLTLPHAPCELASMSRTVILVLSVLLVTGAAFADADWPQWRGPSRTGHVPPDIVVPEQLPAKPKVLWHIPVGFGLASPIVSGGKVFYFD